MGTETASAGIFALTTLFGGRQTAELLRRYIENWRDRVAQVRYMLNALAERGDEEALVVLLSVSEQYPSKALKEHAKGLVGAVADRLGLSRHDLLDRTLPSLDFSPHGTLTPAGFNEVLCITADLQVEVRDTHGKEVKSPTGDLAQIVKVKRREMRKLVKTLRSRYVHALWTEKPWSAADWTRYVIGNPLSQIIAQQLVWQEQVGSDQETRRSFRLADDGSFCQLDDEDRPTPVGLVRLATRTNMSEVEVSAWQNVFADYGLAFFVPQFDAHPYPVTDKAATDLLQQQGLAVNARRLTSGLAKAGFVAENESEYVTHLVAEFPECGQEVWFVPETLTYPVGTGDVVLGSVEFRTLGGQEVLTLDAAEESLRAQTWHLLKQIAGSRPLPGGPAQ